MCASNRLQLDFLTRRHDFFTFLSSSAARVSSSLNFEHSQTTMPTAEQKQLVAGSTAALLAVALLVPSEAKRKAIGRTKIIFELAQMQLQSLLAGRNEADNSFGDYLDANLDVFRFLSKVMYAYKCDLLDTRGDYLQTAPPHLQVNSSRVIRTTQP